MKWLTALLLLCFLFLVNVAHAQLEGDTFFNLKSPYTTLTTFYTNLDDDAWRPALAAKTLYAPNVKKQNKEELVIQLKQILDGRGLILRIEGVPRESNFKDSILEKSRYTPFPDYPSIFLEKRGSRWLWSSYTVKAIPEIHKQVFPFGSDKLVKLLKRTGTDTFLGLYMWQYVAILLLLLLAFLIQFLLVYLIANILSKLLGRFRRFKLASRILQKISKPFSTFLVLSSSLFLVPVIQLPAGISYYLVLLVKALIALSVTLIFYRLVDIVTGFLERYADKTRSSLDDQLVPLVRKALKSFILVVGAIFVLQNLDVNVTALLAGLSIGGLALALAAQDTVKNLFGSAMIFIDKPFQVGDWIQFDGTDGTVEEVGFRSTRLRTFHNSVVAIPNAKLADMKIDNFGLRIFRRYKTTLSLTYDTPPAQVQAFVEGLRSIVEENPFTRKDAYEVHFTDYSSHSLDVLFYIFFDVPSWSEELDAKHEINLQIMQLAKTLGVRFAFPTQTLFVEEVPGIPSLTPNYRDRDARRDLDQFIASQRKPNN